MYLLIFILPIINILNCFRTIGNKSKNFSVIGAIITLIVGLIIISEKNDLIINLGNWIDILNLEINWTLRFDTLTKSMLFPILLISCLVQIFSLSYMGEDPHVSRFYLYLNLFTFAMLILVTGDNWFTLFLGWEGVGLVSYLLVNFWFTRIDANHASLKAFLMNRVGDWGLTLGLILWYVIFGDLTVNLFISNIHPNLIYILGLLLFLGAIAKSAQIGLHSWLTSAMEGPTPVSALLHAATMVTAGIYLLMRLNILIEWSDDLLLIISWFGGLSALTGALGGFYDLDIKKIIAYSTISQLGYMVISVGFSLYSITLWHLINHALFKALLFLSAGAILHNVADVQDIRKYGSLKFYQPNLYLFILIGNLSIMAFPFMTGFYSKDLILDLIFSTHSNFLFFLIYIAALFTASYSLKLLIFTFLAQPNFTFANQPLTHSLSLSFFVPLFTLSLGAIFFGDLSTGIFNTLDFSIHPAHFIEKNNLIFHLASNLTVVPLLFFLLLIYSPKFINYSFFTFIFPSVLTNINLIWSALLLRIFNYSNIFLRYIDRGLLEILTPYGLNLFFHYLAYRLELLSTGYFNHLLLPLILFLIFF